MNLYNLPPNMKDTGRLEFQDLMHLKTRAEDRGLRLIAIENVPIRFYDKIMLGQPGREQQLENMQETIRNSVAPASQSSATTSSPRACGARTTTTPIRGGAISNGFKTDLAKHAPLSYDREYHRRRDVGQLPLVHGAHPAGGRGIQRAHGAAPRRPACARSWAACRACSATSRTSRPAMDTHPSPMHGLDYCHGCWSEMRAGAGVMESIEHFGKQGRLFYIHFRDVKGACDDFTECFIDEGNSDMFQVMLEAQAGRLQGLHDRRPRPEDGQRLAVESPRPRLRHRLHARVVAGGEFGPGAVAPDPGDATDEDPGP